MAEASDWENRLAVTDVLYRYATGIDTKDWTLFHTCFAEKCDLDYGSIGYWKSADEVTEYMERVHQRYPFFRSTYFERRMLFERFIRPPHILRPAMPANG